MEIEESRKRIDTIDKQILALFTERMGVASDIAAYKKRNGLPVLNAAREQAILDRVAAEAKPELAEYAQELFKKLFELSKSFQSKQL